MSNGTTTSTPMTKGSLLIGKNAIQGYTIAFSLVALVAGAAWGGWSLYLSANSKVEAQCTAAGGQVLKVPFDLSRCLQPAAK